VWRVGARHRAGTHEEQMTQYLLSIYQPDGDTPAPEVLEPIMRDVTALADAAERAFLRRRRAALPDGPGAADAAVEQER
jgi:hypothetical protein